eukprot:363885-Chlamydomonas_euryale.AAC.34
MGGQDKVHVCVGGGGSFEAVRAFLGMRGGALKWHVKLGKRGVVILKQGAGRGRLWLSHAGHAEMKLGRGWHATLDEGG